MLQARPVTTEQDVEMLRQVRNSGRQWMTRHTDAISPEQQAAWWAQLDHASVKVWLFSESATDIGYGLVRLEKGRAWCSLAVLPRYQGQGYGTQIYRWLALSQPQWDMWAEIYADNTPSLRAALKAGYQLAHASDKTAVLVYRKGQRS
jgi:RimJ/RimL family protein N-acetyltransferase